MRRSSHSDSSGHIGPGSWASIASSASRTTTRERSRRSKSMSATRSVTPSVSTCCHRDERRRRSSAAARASSSPRTSSSRADGSSRPASSVRTARERWSVTARRSCTSARRVSTSLRSTTSRRRWVTRAPIPDSSCSSRSRCCTASWARAAETANSGASMPRRARWPRSSSATSRQCGQASVLVSTQTTVGHRAAACSRKAISGAVNSWLASDTTRTASAVGSRSTVRSARCAPTPPTPAVSTSSSPSSSRRGSSTSACTSRSVPSPVTRAATWSTGTGTRSVGPSSSGCSPVARTRLARGASPARTSVGTTVATSSATGQTGAPTRPFTSELLPCLGSPTTRTRTRGSALRARAWSSRRCRSGRPQTSASAPARSSSCADVPTGTHLLTPRSYHPGLLRGQRRTAGSRSPPVERPGPGVGLSAGLDLGAVVGLDRGALLVVELELAGAVLVPRLLLGAGVGVLAADGHLVVLDVDVVIGEVTAVPRADDAVVDAVVVLVLRVGHLAVDDGVVAGEDQVVVLDRGLGVSDVLRVGDHGPVAGLDDGVVELDVDAVVGLAVVGDDRVPDRVAVPADDRVVVPDHEGVVPDLHLGVEAVDRLVAADVDVAVRDVDVDVGVVGVAHRTVAVVDRGVLDVVAGDDAALVVDLGDVAPDVAEDRLRVAAHPDAVRGVDLDGRLGVRVVHLLQVGDDHRLGAAGRRGGVGVAATDVALVLVVVALLAVRRDDAAAGGVVVRVVVHRPGVGVPAPVLVGVAGPPAAVLTAVGAAPPTAVGAATVRATAVGATA